VACRADCQGQKKCGRAVCTCPNTGKRSQPRGVRTATVPHPVFWSVNLICALFALLTIRIPQATACPDVRTMRSTP
jgi:hypothetical protein